MGIDVKGEACGSVAEEVLDTLNVRAAGDGNRGCGVPEVVGPRVRPADTGGNLLEILVEGQDHIMPPQLICEHQIVRVAPGRASLQPVLCLPALLCPEVFKRYRRRLDGPGLPAFGGGREEVLTSTGFVLLELLANSDSASLKVYLFPRQAQALPFPQPSE